MKRTNKPTGKGKPKFRFYRSNLPAVVWDPANDKVLADFTQGHFITDDLNVAKVLLDKGYPQIPVDAKNPPNILARIPGKSLKNTDHRLGPLDDVNLKNKLGNQETGHRAPVVQEFVE